MAAIDVSTHQVQEAAWKALSQTTCKHLTLDDVLSIWHAVGALVRQQCSLGKGLRITAFGTFTVAKGEP